VGTKRVVFSSSGGTVYGIPENSPVTEKCFTRPISAYGISKLSVEHYLDLYKNLNGISLRIGNPYGAYQLRGTSIGLIARVLNSIKEKTPIQVWGDGSIVRDYINIKSVANAFALSLLTKNLEPGAYNIGTGVGRSINDIIQAAFDVTGRKTPVIYSKPRGFDVSTIVLDNSKFSSATGWKTYPESLHEEIEQLWEFLQKVNS
jgi:UDP-glucose 4-epimerase